MKHTPYKTHRLLSLLLALLLTPCFALAEGGMLLTDDKEEVHGASGSVILYPKILSKDASTLAAADKMNQLISETARIPEYLQLLPTIGAGSAGLRMDYDLVANPSFYQGTGYLSLLFSAEGKMLAGRPGQVYYPLVLDAATGERISFDQVFTDPEGAKAYMEEYLVEQVEPALSTYLENSQLLPIPYDQFAFSGMGHITFYYPQDQLSFLSGQSGAVSFRYSELWDYLDTSDTGIALSMKNDGLSPSQYPSAQEAGLSLQQTMQDCCVLGFLPGLGLLAPFLGTPMEQVRQNYPISTDSGFYPGGVYLETEKPELRGAYLLADEGETYITGILTSRVDAYGIETGKTPLGRALELLGAPLAQIPLDEAAAAMYLVCPGTAATYRYDGATIAAGNTGSLFGNVSLTLYADEAGIVQFIKLSLEK